METLISGDVRPRAGDLVLAQVSELGKHQRIELINGRRARIFPGDAIIVVYGNRYAPDQFEALVGDDLSGCDLVASGGVAAHEVCRHERMPEPTRIQPIGLIGNRDGCPLNLRDFRISLESRPPVIPVVLVAGTAMNSGKTMTSGSLVRGFRNAGLKVAGIKATGTGSGGDLWFMSDMGANRVFDFTDAGFASTYQAPPDAILEGVLGLIGHAGRMKHDVAVVEIADGLQHEETSVLLNAKQLQQSCVGVVFAAYDSLGATAGVHTLTDIGYRVFALSGQITRSPLAIREAVRALRLPVLTPLEIQAGVLVQEILDARQNQHPSHRSQAQAIPGVATPVRSNDNEVIAESRVRRHTDAMWRPSVPNVVRSLPNTEIEVVRWLEGRDGGGSIAETLQPEPVRYENGNSADAD